MVDPWIVKGKDLFIEATNVNSDGSLVKKWH